MNTSQNNQPKIIYLYSLIPRSMIEKKVIKVFHENYFFGDKINRTSCYSINRMIKIEKTETMNFGAKRLDMVLLVLLVLNSLAGNYPDLRSNFYSSNNQIFLLIVIRVFGYNIVHSFPKIVVN